MFDNYSKVKIIEDRKNLFGNIYSTTIDFWHNSLLDNSSFLKQ